MRGFSLMFGTRPALKIALRLCVKSKSGHALQTVQPLWQEHRICFVDWCDRNRHQHESVVVDDREDFFALLLFVAGIADPIAAFLGHGVGVFGLSISEGAIANILARGA